MSHELVPITYDRQAYNILQAAETRHHGDLLTARQAEAINDAYDIYVVPVRHGYGLDQDLKALENGNAPGNADYEYVKNVVDNMSTSDVLLAEGVGFLSENEAPLHLPDEKTENALDRIYGSNNAGTPDYEQLRNAKARLASDREGYEIDSVEYAIEYALLNGITVVYADMDAYDNGRLDAVIGGDGRSLTGSPWDKSHLQVADSIRERKAVNTVKDIALEKLQDAQMQRSTSGEKSKLILLYGLQHAVALKDGFDNLGINSSVLPEATDDPDRRREEFNRHLERGRSA